MNSVFTSRMNREETVKILKEIKAERVFLALESNCIFEPKRSRELTELRENCRYLKDRGFEVGAWLWTFMINGECDFCRMMSPDGKTSGDMVCPTDERYCGEITSLIADIAAQGVDLIMFDDDYRYGFFDIGFGCLCEGHYRKICEILGRDPGREAVAYGIMNGGNNEYRTAFLKANGAVFEEFAAKCRKSVDGVNPDVRLGFCSCITSWDIDGTEPDRISRILAGKTKPFYRLIGAPYWAARNAWGHRLSYVIEQERLESSRRLNKDIEIFSEGDSYPRPRFHTPASFVEGMDTALRADGTLDGILKYSFDYTSSLDYERGYNEMHLKNMPLYDKIGEFFDGKEAVGVRIYDKMKKFADIEMPTHPAEPSKVQETAFCATARFLSVSGIPTVYSGKGCAGAAFGEDAGAVPDEALENGIILDYSAAKLLSAKGIDVGIVSESGTVSMRTEYFADGEATADFSGTAVHAVTLNEKAEVGSFADKEKTVPVFYRYENAKKQKFAVFTFDGYFANDDVFRNYKRHGQIAESVKWMNGKGLPVDCGSHPELYVLAKEADGEMSFGMWNFFPDPIYAPAAEFTKAIKSAEIFGGEGKIDGNRIVFSELAPYGTLIARVRFE